MLLETVVLEETQSCAQRCAMQIEVTSLKKRQILSYSFYNTPSVSRMLEIYTTKNLIGITF